MVSIRHVREAEQETESGSVSDLMTFQMLSMRSSLTVMSLTMKYAIAVCHDSAVPISATTTVWEETARHIERWSVERGISILLIDR